MLHHHLHWVVDMYLVFYTKDSLTLGLSIFIVFTPPAAKTTPHYISIRLWDILLENNNTPYRCNMVTLFGVKGDLTTKNCGLAYTTEEHMVALLVIILMQYHPMHSPPIVIIRFIHSKLLIFTTM